jgi:ribonuclease R
LEQAVLAYVLRDAYRPVKPRVIAKKLGLDEEQARALRLVIKKLVQRGRLAYGEKHLVCRPPATSTAIDTATVDAQPEPRPPDLARKRRRPVENRGADVPRSPALNAQRSTLNLPHDGRHLAGVFRRTDRGFGFVRPAGTPPGGDRTQDIYVPGDKAGDAASGDTVLVRLSRSRPRGPAARLQRSGEIIEVLERETHQFVGTYFEAEGAGFVTVDGRLFAAPIRVGDPGAKNARPDDKVVFEMVRFPSHLHDGEGVISQVLGPRGAPGVDTLSIIHEFGLPGEFPETALAEARRQAERFNEADLAGRRDLTAETIVTIDPVDARDFDDAISLERIERGHWLLGVHIADVAHFVEAGSPLDREAYARATSVYLPDRVIPMLPEIISNGLASLQPERVRYARSAFIEYDPAGVPIAAEFAATAIRSARRFTYEEVDDYLEQPEDWRSKLSPKVHTLLGRMRELAALLRGRRVARGALELTLPEVKIDLDRDGKVSGAHLVAHTESHQIIEEFMLAANVAVAERLRDAGLAFLRRTHAAPDPRKLKALTEFVAALGLETGSLESRFELQRLLGQVRDRPEEHAVNYALLRSLQRAVYSPAEEGHYALAAECYCHFTSPIRRYPDLTVHRLLDQILHRKRPAQDMAHLVAQAEHCTEREQRAEDAERELTKVKLLTHLAGCIGLEMEAIVTGVEEFGLFARGVELPAEGMLHITALADDYYHYDRRTHTLEGRRAGHRFRLGDRLRVEVAHVDVDRRELDFRLVQRSAVRRAARVQRPGKAERGRRTPRGRVQATRTPRRKPRRG